MMRPQRSKKTAHKLVGCSTEEVKPRYTLDFADLVADSKSAEGQPSDGDNSCAE